MISVLSILRYRPVRLYYRHEAKLQASFFLRTSSSITRPGAVYTANLSHGLSPAITSAKFNLQRNNTSFEESLLLLLFNGYVHCVDPEQYFIQLTCKRHIALNNVCKNGYITYLLIFYVLYAFRISFHLAVYFIIKL